MEFKNHLEQYARLGYTKISKAIDKKLLLEINNSILDLILKKKFSNLNKCAEEFEKFIISYVKKEQSLFISFHIWIFFETTLIMLKLASKTVTFVLAPPTSSPI